MLILMLVMTICLRRWSYADYYAYYCASDYTYADDNINIITRPIMFSICHIMIIRYLSCILS